MRSVMTLVSTCQFTSGEVFSPQVRCTLHLYYFSYYWAQKDIYTSRGQLRFMHRVPILSRSVKTFRELTRLANLLQSPFRDPLTLTMSTTTDSRRDVGSNVTTRARLVTSLPECRRLFGAAHKTKEVTGVVVSVESKPTKKRSVTYIIADWALPSGTKRASVNLASVKLAPASTPQAVATQPPDRDERPDEVTAEISDARRDDAVTDPSHATQPPVLRSKSQINERPHTDEPTAAAHGREWNAQAVTLPLNGSIPKRDWSVRGSLGQHISFGHAPRDLEPIDFFLLMFPSEHLSKIVHATSRRLRARAKKPTSAGEFLRFFGVLVLMTRVEFADRRSLWESDETDKRVQQVNLCKDMSRHRFEKMLSHIAFSGEQHPATYDRWSEVEGFVKAINDHRRSVVTPSEYICVDESISRWYGLGGEWTDLGLPHYVKLDRKPESGCELKTACCGKSGLLLALEITKSAEQTAQRSYEDTMQHGTATVLRLVEPWFHTNRLVCADSFFASVATAQKLWEVGLRFTGVVKTATRHFPLSYLSHLEMAAKGEHNCLVSKGKDDDHSLMALCWLDRERRYFISTTSTTKPGAPIFRTRPRVRDGRTVRVEIEIPIPEVCESYYQVCSKIDQHNRCRQDDLNIEKKLRTTRWSTRVNSSLLAICVVDGWLLYKNSFGLANHMNPWDFYKRLANGLLDNKFDSVALRKRKSPTAEPTRSVLTGTGIHLVCTERKQRRKDGSMTNHTYQGNCVVCKTYRKSRFYCSECFALTDKEVYICPTEKGRACFEQHINSRHDRS